MNCTDGAWGELLVNTDHLFDGEQRRGTHDLIGRPRELVLERLQCVPQDDLGRSVVWGGIKGMDPIPVAYLKVNSAPIIRCKYGADAPQREPRRPERRDTPNVIIVVIKC